MATRLPADLDDPRLLRLLEAEANDRETSIKEVLTRALEAYFAERLETRALAKLAESVRSPRNRLTTLAMIKS